MVQLPEQVRPLHLLFHASARDRLDGRPLAVLLEPALEARERPEAAAEARRRLRHRLARLQWAVESATRLLQL